MKGFDPKFKDFPDYIIGITKEIWEDRGIATLHHYYSDDIVVRSPGSVVVGNQGVIAATMATLAEFPDRTLLGEDVIYHFFADNNFVGVTGWPNMIQSVTHDGWMGLAPTGKEINMRSLDFWRLENGLIRENWVMVDILDVYRQLGVDVFARLREFNKARSLPPIALKGGQA